MTHIDRVEVYDLKQSIVSCRNAMAIEPIEFNDAEFKKALERAKKLVKAAKISSGHANFRTGIRVSFDLTYTQYFTKQLQRYHWIDYVSSSSMMHRIQKMDFTKCCNKYVDSRVIGIIEELKANYNNSKSYEDFMKLISNCPMGAELFVRVSTNYEQLATIYEQRKNHKLKEDWGAVMNMINCLPCSYLITGEGL